MNQKKFDSSVEERLYRDHGYITILKGINAMRYLAAYNDFLEGEGLEDTPELFFQFVKDMDEFILEEMG